MSDTRRRKSAREASNPCVVPKSEIAGAGYDLSVRRYSEVQHEAKESASPKQILGELLALEDEIRKGLEKLEGMLV